MALWNNFPYSNVHELNLNWIIEKMKYLIDQWESYGTTVDADAVAGLAPAVTVTGDLKEGLTFHFTLVKGDEGPEGPQGVSIVSATMNASYQLTLNFSDGTSWTSPSLRGATGAGLMILDEYATLADLQTAHPTGDSGDAYLVGTSPNFTLYIWSASSAAWVDGGALTSPSPTTTTPLMDGAADIGSEVTYARGDHVHPSDTSKQNVLTAGSGIAIVSDVISAAIPSDLTPEMDGAGSAGISDDFSRADHVHPSDTSKQDALTAGDGIVISGGSISADVFNGIDTANVVASYASATNIASTTYAEDVYIIASRIETGTLTVDGVALPTRGDSSSGGVSYANNIMIALKAGQAWTCSRFIGTVYGRL